MYLFFSHIFHHFTKIFNSKQLEYQGEVDQNQAKRTQGFRSQDSVNLKKGQQEGVKVVLLGADYILIRYSSHMLQSVYKCSLSLTLMTVHFSLSLIYSNRAYIMNELSWRPPLHLGHLVYPNHRGAGPLCAVSLLLLLADGIMGTHVSLIPFLPFPLLTIYRLVWCLNSSISLVICILCKYFLLWHILRELHQIIIFLFIYSPSFHLICITIKYSIVSSE